MMASGLHVVEQRHPPRQPPPQRQPPQPDTSSSTGGDAGKGQGSHGPTGAASTTRTAGGDASDVGGADGSSSPNAAAPAILLRLEAEVWVPPAGPPSGTGRQQQGGPDQGTEGGRAPDCNEAPVDCDSKDVVGYVVVELWPSGGAAPFGSGGDGQGREGQGGAAGGGAAGQGVGGCDGGKRGANGTPLARVERPVGRQELRRGGQHFIGLEVGERARNGVRATCTRWRARRGLRRVDGVE